MQNVCAKYNTIYDTVQTQHYSQQHSRTPRRTSPATGRLYSVHCTAGRRAASSATQRHIWLNHATRRASPRRARSHCPLTLLYPSQLTCSVTFCFCGVEQGGRHSYSGRSRRPGRWVICKICNTTLFTILSILSFFANFVEHRRVFSRPEDGLTDVEELKGVSHWFCI